MLARARARASTGETSLPGIKDHMSVAPDVRRDPRIEARLTSQARPRIEASVGSVTGFKIPRLDTATSAAHLRGEAKAPQGGVRP